MLLIGLSGVRASDKGRGNLLPGPWCSDALMLGPLVTHDPRHVTSWHTVLRPGYMRTWEIYKFGWMTSILFFNTWTLNIPRSMSFLRRFSCKLVQLTIVSVINIYPISQNAFQRPRNLRDACQLLIDVYWLAPLSARSTCTAGSALQSPVTLT